VEERDPEALAHEVALLQQINSRPFFYIPDVFLMLSMIFIAIAFANPWYKRELKENQHASPEIEMMVDS
ncbi:MAG: hypothetical protein ACFFBJ_10245, partial [Promethearchaeota archaeon]